MLVGTKILKTEYVGETKGPNSREGHLAEALSNLPLNPQEMVKVFSGH